MPKTTLQPKEIPQIVTAIDRLEHAFHATAIAGWDGRKPTGLDDIPPQNPIKSVGKISYNEYCNDYEIVVSENDLPPSNSLWRTLAWLELEARRGTISGRYYGNTKEDVRIIVRPEHLEGVQKAVDAKIPALLEESAPQFRMNKIILLRRDFFDAAKPKKIVHLFDLGERLTGRSEEAKMYEVSIAQAMANPLRPGQNQITLLKLQPLTDFFKNNDPDNLISEEDRKELRVHMGREFATDRYLHDVVNLHAIRFS